MPPKSRYPQLYAIQHLKAAELEHSKMINESECEYAIMANG